MSSSEQIELENRLQLIKSATLINVAARPDAGGTSGRPINLVTNTYSLVLQTRGDGYIYHYDIKISAVEETGAAQRQGRPLPARLLHEIFEHGIQQAVAQGGITPQMASMLAYDGRSNAYTVLKLPFPTFTFTVQLPPKAALPPVPGSPAATASGPPPTSRRDSERNFQMIITFARATDPAKLIDYCNSNPQLVRAAGTGVVEEVYTGLQALDVLLRHEPTKIYKVHGAQGRRFFDPNNSVPIANGAEIWKGFFQSVRPTQSGLVVNIDVAFSAFIGGGDFLAVAAKILNLAPSGGGGGGGRGFRGGRGGGGFRGGRGGPPARGGYGGYQGGESLEISNLAPNQLQELRKRLKGVQIRVTHRPTNKVEIFKGFTPRPAKQIDFTMKDGTKQNVVTYYNYRIKYPNLPCILLGNGKTFVPIEVCMIVPGTPVPPLRLNPMQVQDMIRESAQRPDQRRARIEEIRRQLNYDGDNRLKSWGITISRQLVPAQGRMLTPPVVQYAPGGQQPRINNGSWNLANVRFVQGGGPLITWAVINFSNAPQQIIQHYVDAQVQSLKSMGVKVVNTKPLYLQERRDPALVFNAMNNAGRAAYTAAKTMVGNKRPPLPQLFLCIMDAQDATFYEEIKRCAALRLASPVPTQVVNTKKAFQERGQMQYVANVGMKINIKLGGTNQVVAGERDLPNLGPETMLLGADVTHAGPGSDRPSIAATVATMDGKRNRYSAELRAQSNPRRGQSQEIMLHAKDMIIGHFKRWQSKNQGRLPSSVVVFRDGVSEGQFQSAVDNELQAIKEAARSIRPDAIVKVTYVVCGKRHRIKFFAQNPNDNDQRSGNLQAGTILDRAIVHPYAFDFYLQSQAGLVGTARPCHYVVLRDENGFTSDTLQRCIYSLCYSYARATRSVSLVPVAYYADILAEKARPLMYTDEDTATSVTSESREERPLQEVDSKAVMRLLERSSDFCESQWYM
ncbi:Piwi-domain-containing protein [Violaceomyces palustris]|uniref:Piwi-domain-containing protein n=1 Tax=Violaceomyces palustris TaxID=1673888 RepID=A0ACD0NQX8_9BASI|nr:Piwi-domain-containing protein [Violaceomyces palustris]